jgi:hypothetical protein
MPWDVSTEEKYLRCLLYGGVPILNPEEKEVERFKFLAYIHKHIGKDELIDHKFIGEDYKAEETTYSSGVKIHVNFETGTYIIKGVPGISEDPRNLLSISAIK